MHSDMICCASMLSSGEENFTTFMTAEVEEILKYKWYMGEKLGYDPLRDRSMNDICEEWITKYAASFRTWWFEKKQ
jgi:hypothetical protein